MSPPKAVAPPVRFWTPSMIGAVAPSIAALLLALITLWVSVGIKEDTQHIVISTNSTLSDFAKKLEVAQTRIEEMEKRLTANAEAKKTADELAAKETK